MIGAIAGDIIGSIYEFDQIKTKEFPLFDKRCFFTDDSVMTIAVAEAILTKGSYLDAILKWGRRYPNLSYGVNFRQWLLEDSPQPYNSWGNGAPMRVGAIGLAFNSVDEVLAEAKASAVISHNHPEGIKGAQAVALAIFLARTTHDKTHIKSEISRLFNYDLNRTVDSIRPHYYFNESSQETAPEAIVAFLDASSYEDAIRNAISLGGDSDTIACITGSIAEAFYGGIPAEIETAARSYLTPDLLQFVDAFSQQFSLA